MHSSTTRDLGHPLIRILLLLLVTLTVLACASKQRAPVTSKYSLDDPATLPPSLKIPLRQHGGYLLVRSRINGRDAGYFLLDTGSSRSALTYGLEGAFDLPQGRPGVAHGVGGTQSFTAKQADDLAIGDLSLGAAELAVVRLQRLTQRVSPFSGIIGFGTIASIPFTVDYQASTLTAHQPAGFNPGPDSTPYPLKVHHNVPLIRVKLGDNHAVWLLIDTGSDSHITLPWQYAQKWPDILATGATGRGFTTGIGGTISNAQTWLSSIQLLGQRLRNTPVTFERSGDPASDRPSALGRIGHRILKHFKLTFDAPHSRVYATWTPRE